MANYDRVITVKIDKETLEKLEFWSRVEGVTRSELVRQAIRHYLRHLERARRKPKTIILTS